MQHDAKSSRIPLRIDTLGAALEQGIDNEAAVLDVLLGAAAKGQPHPELWEKLHQAATKSDRLAELAFAYEKLCGERRLALLQPAVQAEVLMHAAVFFADVFGDSVGSRGYLERVIALAPSRPDAFARLDAVLREGQEQLKLAELYVTVAGHRSERADQLSLLGHAIEALGSISGEEDRKLKLLQQVLKIDPSNVEARRALEENYTNAGKFSELAKLLEHVLSSEPAPAEDEALDMRGRLIGFYAGELKEIERAVPHVEEVLAKDPKHERALRVAETLLTRKGVAMRVAPVLESVYERTGRVGEAIKMMNTQIETLRGPKRVEVQKRLADILFQKAGDLQNAFGLYEAIVGFDPGDERVRERYLSLVAVLDKRLEATRVLGRAGAGAKDKAVRARIGVEIGELHNDLGDARKARGSFQQVLDAGVDDEAMLRAARAVAKLNEKEGDIKGFAQMLSRLADMEPEASAREDAAERLGRICLEELQDAAGAIAAYRKLVGTEREGMALEALERLYEATSAHAELAGVLERRAARESNRAMAQQLAFRAADLRTTKLADRPLAIESWRSYLATFGPSQDVHARLLPLLEQEKRWTELAETYAAEVQLTQGAERAALLGRLGALRATRLQDPTGALEAYREALALDNTEKTSRLAVEKLLGSSDQRLQACAILEPIARSEGNAQLLLRVLEVKASALEEAEPATRRAPVQQQTTLVEKTRSQVSDQDSMGDLFAWGEEPEAAEESPAAAPLIDEIQISPAEVNHEALEQRLAALDEAVKLAERELKDGKKALELATQGLKVAVAKAIDQVVRWIGEVERLTEGSNYAAKRAMALGSALGSRAIDSSAISTLAKRAGEAMVASGDVAQALEVYRRALEYEPSSPELIARVDALLLEQGKPEERIALYREALGRPTEPTRRRELLHAIGGIQRRDLGDLDGAAVTYRSAISEDPDDRAAYESLLETLVAAGAWNALYDELWHGPGGREVEPQQIPPWMGRVPSEQHVEHELRMAEVAVKCGWAPRAADHYRRLLSIGAVLDDNALNAIEDLARSTQDTTLLREVFQRRVASASDAEQESIWLERLGDLAAATGDNDAAASAWNQASALAERSLTDVDRAQRLCEQVLSVAPHHRESAARLSAIYRERGAWDRLPAVCEVLVETASDEQAALQELGSLEEAAIRSGATDQFVAVVERLRQRFGLGPRSAVQMALARVLSADAGRQDDAAQIYRQMLALGAMGDASGVSDKAALEAFQAFLAADSDSPARKEDQRWLYGWLTEHTADDERVGVLSTWASWEERVMGDQQAAATLYARVIELDPEHDDALSARTRLLMDVGDFAGAAEVITKRRDRSEGSARVELNAELAGLYLDRLGRPDEALNVIAPALEEGTLDAATLSLAERILARPEAWARTAELLERACDVVTDSEVSVALLEMLLAKSPQTVGQADGDDILAARRRWFERLLELRQEDPTQGLDVALRAVEALPGELALWDRVDQLGREANQPQRVGEAYARVLDNASSPQDEASISAETLEELGQRAVEHHEEWFDAPETTMNLLRRLVELVPGSVWGFERLKLAYNAAERWEDLFALYDTMLARTEDKSERVFLLEDAAAVARDLAGDQERTMHYLEALLPLQDDPRTRATLERLYEKYSKHRPLIDLLESGLPKLAPDVAQQLRERIAQLWIDGVGDAASALPIVEQMLEHEAASKEAFELLERILAAPSGASVRQRAAVLLEKRYRAEDKPTELVRVLEIQLEEADVAAHAALLSQIVRLRRDALGDEAGALERLATLVELDPAATEPRAELTELAERLKRHDKLADVLSTAASHTADAPLAIALLNEAAAIQRDRLSNRDAAIALLRRTYSLADAHDDTDAALVAIRELDQLLAATGRVAERCDVLDLLAAREPEQTARRAALGQLAHLSFTTLRDSVRAIAAYTACLSDNARDLEALDGLAVIYEEARQFAELAEVLDRRAVVRGGDDARQDLGRVAHLFEQELGNLEQAISTWLRIRAELGHDIESAEALTALYARTERWFELVDLLDREATQSEDAARTGDLWRRLGDVHRDHTLDWLQAVESYRKAYEAGNKEARAGLEQLLTRIDLQTQDHPDALIAVVEQLLAICVSENDWAGQVALLEPRLATASSTQERVEILRNSAKLLEDPGGNVSGSFDLVWRAFLLIPGPEHPTELLRLAGAAVRWQVIADALPSLEARGDVPTTTLRDLWWRVAAWQRDVCHDADAAVHAFEQALAHEPHNSAILTELAEVQRRTPGSTLIVTLLRLADVVTDNLDLYREAVQTAMDPVGDFTHAREIASKLLELAIERWPQAGDSSDAQHPSHAALWAIDALVRLLKQSGEPAEIVALCRRGAALAFPLVEQRRLRRMAAESAEIDEAITLYADLFQEDPTDEPIGERLASLLREVGRREDLVALRKQQLAVCEDIERRVALRYDAALLLAEIGEGLEAIDALRTNLEELPEHAPSAQKLATLLESGGLYRDLVRLREEQANARQQGGESAAAAALWLEAASIAERELNDLDRTIADYRQAADLGATPALDALARLLAGRGDYAAAAEALERLCAVTDADKLHTETLRLAEVYVAGGRAELARACIERAVPVATQPAPLRERLALLYREAGAYVALAELIATNASLTEDPAARLALLREAADLHLTRGDTPAAAIPLLDEAIDLAPDELPLRLSRCRALAAAGRTEDALETLRAVIADFGKRRPKERALVHYELARVHVAQNDPVGAMRELDLALRIDPAHADALNTLGGLALEAGQFGKANQAYRALLLIVRRPGSESPVTRSEVLLSLSEIARRQNEPDREAEYVESAFESARENELEHQRLISSLRTHQRHELLARALEEQLQGLAPDAVAMHVSLLDELARLYDGPLQRLDAALDARLGILPLTPDAHQAFEAALDLAQRVDQLAKYIAVVEGLAEQASNNTRSIDMHLHLGQALGLSPGNDDRSAQVYRRVESLLTAQHSTEAAAADSKLQLVWRSLEAIYGRLGAREALAEVLQKRIDAAAAASAPAPDRADPCYKLATLYAETKNTLDEGVALLERAIEIQPDYDAAETILRTVLRVDSKNPRAIQLLERIARDDSRDRTLVDALVLRADIDDSPLALQEAVQIARELGDLELAESILKRLVNEDASAAPPSGRPEAAWALIAMADLREQLGNLAAAVVLRERAARLSPPDEERTLLLRAASLAAGPLNDLPRAARLYEELRGREPAEREIWEPLADIYRRSDQPDRLSALLEDTVPLVESIDERCQLRFERARLLMSQDQEQAITLLREVLEEDPSQGDAATLLASMLETAGRLQELCDLFALQLDAAKDRSDIPTIITLSLRLGGLLEQRDDDNGALDVYHAASDWDNKHREILRAIVRINLRREDSVDLTDSLDKLLEVEQGEDAVVLALQLAQLRAAHDDPEGAEQALEVGYAASPTNDHLREELAARYTAREAWDKLAGLYILESQARSSDEGRVECLCHAAEILRQRANNSAKAAEILETALSIIPADRDVLLAYIDACTALGEHERAIAAITKALETLPHDPFLFRSRADLYRALDNVNLALADLEQAYVIGGRTYASDLVIGLEHALQKADSQPDGAKTARDLRIRLADVLVTSGDFDRARDHLTDLLRQDGKDRAALRILAAIEESTDRWDAASAVYRRLIALDDGEALIETALSLASACEKVDRLGDARGGLERALRVAPTNTEVRERLRALYIATGANRELAAMTLEDAMAATDLSVRSALLLRAGRLLIDAEEPVEAVSVLEQARTLRSDDQETALLLVDACAAAGRGAEARALLNELIVGHRGRRSKSLGAVLHRLARLEALEGHPRESLTALSKAFENDPQNGALAMELAGYALERGEHEIAARAFRAVTMMKIAPDGSADGTTSFSRAVAYYHLGSMALAIGDRRKALLMLDKSVAEDGSLDAARVLLEELRNA